MTYKCNAHGCIDNEAQTIKTQILYQGTALHLSVGGGHMRPALSLPCLPDQCMDCTSASTKTRPLVTYVVGESGRQSCIQHSRNS